MADIVINPAIGKIDFFTTKGDNVTNTLKLTGNTLLVTGPLSASSISTGGGGAFVTSTQPTANYLSKFTGNSTIANSLIYDNGTNVGIGTTSPGAKLAIIGTRLTDPNNDSQSREIFYAVGRTVASAAGSTTLLGYLTPTGRSDHATIEIYHHDCGTIEYIRYELVSAYYVGTTTDWVQLPTINNISYTGALGGVTVDARLASTGANIELRLRSLGDSCGNMSVYVSIKSNCTFTEQSTTGTGGTVSGLLCNNAYQFPVGANRFEGTTSRGLYITNAGNVGIGTQSPAYKLDVSGNARFTSDTFVNGNLMVSKAGANLYINGSNSDAELHWQANGTSRWAMGMNVGDATENLNIYNYTTATTNFTILKASGNVGIGSSSPVYKLDVNGIIASAGVAIAFFSGNYNRLYEPAGNVGIYLGNNTDPANYYDNTTHYFRNRGGSTNYAIINSSGNLGVGTTIASYKVDVVGAVRATIDNDFGFVLKRSATNVWTGIGYYTANNSKWFVGLRETGDDNLRWYNYTNSAERMVLTEAGSLGVGTTSPGTKLDVVGEITTPVIKQSATLYTGTDITDDNSTRTVYFNIPLGGYSPPKYFKVARIKITGNYQNVSLNGYFTTTNSTGLHVGSERKVEFDFIAYAATNPGAPTVTYLKRGPDTTNVLVYAVPNGGGAGTTYYDVYIKSAWYNDTNGELAVRVGYSSAVTIWQAGLDSGTSAPTDTLVNPNSSYSFDTSGNIGIGTTSPAYKLDVVSGSIRASSGAYAGELYFGTNNNADLYLKRDNGYDLSLVQNASSGNALYLAGAGNVYLSIDSNNNETTSAFIVQNNAIKSGTELFRVNEAGSAIASSDFRAPIFYDSNNTSYYVDPASTSNLNAVTLNNAGSSGYLTLPGTVTISNVSSNEMVIRNLGQLRFSTSTSWDWNSWAGLKYDASATTIYMGGPAATSVFTANATPPSVTISFVGTTSVNSDSSFRAPIFYDSNNTSYYVDPASTSNLNVINSVSLNGNYIGVSNTTNTNGYGISLYNGASAGEPTYGLMFQGTATFGTYGSVTGNWATYFTMNNDDSRGWIFRKVSTGNVASISGGGILTVAGDVRAPIFYDSANTSYYVDPASTSNLNILSVTGYQYINGQTLNGQSFYQWEGATYRNPGDHTPQLLITKTNSTTGINGFAPALALYNNNGADQTTVGMTFVSAEAVSPTQGNSVELAGIIAKKESTGTAGGWSRGSLNFYTKDFGTRKDVMYMSPDGTVTVTGTDNNSGKADFSVDTGGTATMALSGQYFRVGSTDVNWAMKMQSNGYLATYGQQFDIATVSGDNAITFATNGTNRVNIGGSVTETVKITGYANYVGNYGYNTLTLIDTSGYPGLNYRSGNNNWLMRMDGGGTYSMNWSSNASAKDVGTFSTPFYFGTGGTAYASNDFRAPIFYDANDTSYYVDPNGTTNLLTLSVNRINNLRPYVDTWHTSTDGTRRFYFANGGTTYYSTGNNFVFRNSSDVGVVTIDGSGNLRTSTSGDNYASYSLHVGGTGFASADFRAPIFYDSNNTGYYLDPASTTTSLQIAGAIEQGNDLARPLVQWGASGDTTGMIVIKLPGTSSNYGMIHAVIDIYEYSGANVSTIIVGGHNWNGYWYNYGSNVVGYTNKTVRLGFKDGQYCIVLGGAASVWSYGQVVLRKIQNGSYYTNIMDLGGTYSISQTATESFTWVTGDLTQLRTPGTFIAYGDIRAPIFYDSNDTSYYVDPNSLSNIVELKTNKNWYDSSATAWGGGINMAGNNPTIGFQSTASTWWFMLHHSSDSINFYRRSTSGGWNQDCIWDSSGNFIWRNGSIRAPIFYDFNNTSYYLDPASTSNLNVVNLVGITGAGNAYIQTTSTGTSYTSHFQIREASGGGGSTNEIYAPALGFHWSGVVASNILMESSGRIAIRNNPGSGYENFIANAIYGAVFYDSNNTTYYLDPDASTSLNIAGQITTAKTNGTLLSIAGADTIGYNATAGRGAYIKGTSTTYVYGSGVYYDGSNIRQMLYEDTWLNNKYFGSDGIIYSAVSMRAPIFYDYNDTNYYLDPNGNSVLKNVNVNGLYPNSSTTDSDIYARDALINSYYHGDALTYDVFQFRAASLYEIKLTSTHSFSSTTVETSIFKGDRFGGMTIANNTYQVRWTWSNTIGYKFFKSLYIGNSTNGNSFAVTIEYSGNGTTWTTLATSAQMSNWPGHSWFTYLWNNNAAQGYLRLTITPVWSTVYDINIYNMRYFASYNLDAAVRLYDWDYSRNVTFANSVTTNYGTFASPGIILGDAQYGFYVSAGNVYYKSASGGVHYWRNTANSGDNMSLDNSGILSVAGSVRSPIFYDSNNTSYYVDPASTGYSAYFAGAIQATKIGIEDGGIDCYMEITDANPVINGITYGGEFIFYGDKSTPASYLYFGGATVSNILQANGSLRAPIFYDSDDTTYYLDAASTSLSLKTRSSILINNASSPQNLAMLNIGYNGAGETRAIDIYGGWSGGENKSISFTHGSTAADIVAQINGQHNGPGSKLRFGKLYHGGNSSTYTMELISESTTSAYLTVVGSVRSPIFYDSDNTAYYLDPNSTSNLVGLTVANTITGNISGNAATATNAVNLSTTRTNWSTNGTITAVVGQLCWKNYGNNHTIIDASNSTSPAGGAIGNTNPDYPWTGTYPTLMGWNGANTYGVRVDSARYSDQATTAVVNSGNTSAAWYPIVWHSGNTHYSTANVQIYAAGGYIQAAYFNSSDNDETNITRFIIKNGDNYHRSATTTSAADIIRGVASGNWGINITGNAATCTTANAVASGAVKAAGLDNSVSFTMAGLTSNGTINIFPTYATGYSYFLRMGYDNSGNYDYTIKRNGTTGFLEFNGTQTNYVSYYFVLNGTGGLGIGVSPSSRLHVNGDGTNPAIRIDNGAINTSVTSNGRTFYGWLPISIAGTTRWIQLYT